jgi:hypothetical protein
MITRDVRLFSLFYRTDKKSPEAVEGQLTERKAGRPPAYYCKGGTQKTGVPPQLNNVRYRRRTGRPLRIR